MQKWEEVWKKQFGSKSEFAFDFTGHKIEKKFYQKDWLSHSWDIYYVEDDKCIIVSSKIFKDMPINWKNNFFINDKEYKFAKNKNNDFEIFLLKNMENEESESLLMDDSYSINISELLEGYPFENESKIFPIKKDDIFLKNNYEVDSNELELLENDFELVEKEKKKIFQKRLIEKNYKIWESIFGDETIATDFAGSQINKYEFDMGTNHSWKVDYYNIDEDNVRFIALAENIDKRAGRKTFEIDGIEYNIVIVNGKYSIINSKQKSKILFSPELLLKEIEKYFPSFSTDEKSTEAEIPNYSSLLINLSIFPIDELEKLRIMLQKLLKEINVFQDIFIYLNDRKNFNQNGGNNCYIRIFFKSNNITSEDIKIFNTSIIIKNALSVVISNIKIIYNLTVTTNFTMFLTNYNKKYKYISWFTSHDIDEVEDRPKRSNRGELIVDKFYYDLFVGLKGYRNSFVALRAKSDNNFFLCNIDINNMTEYIEEKIIKNKSRTIR